MTTSRIAELVAIGIAFAACFIWVGRVDADVSAAKADVAEVKAEVKSTPTNVAVLETKVATLTTMMAEVKTEQAKQADKLDKILEEVRRR